MGVARGQRAFLRLGDRLYVQRLGLQPERRPERGTERPATGASGWAAARPRPIRTTTSTLSPATATFNANSATAPNTDYGDSLLQVSSSLAVLQSFTPTDQAQDDSQDHDFGSGGTARAGGSAGRARDPPGHGRGQRRQSLRAQSRHARRSRRRQRRAADQHRPRHLRDRRLLEPVLLHRGPGRAARRLRAESRRALIHAGQRLDCDASAFPAVPRRSRPRARRTASSGRWTISQYCTSQSTAAVRRCCTPSMPPILRPSCGTARWSRRMPLAMP